MNSGLLVCFLGHPKVPEGVFTRREAANWAYMRILRKDYLKTSETTVCIYRWRSSVSISPYSFIHDFLIIQLLQDFYLFIFFFYHFAYSVYRCTHTYRFIHTARLIVSMNGLLLGATVTPRFTTFTVPGITRRSSFLHFHHE